MVCPHNIIYEDEVGVVYLEVTPQGAPFVHFNVYKDLSLSVYKHMKHVFGDVLRAFREQGFRNIFCCQGLEEAQFRRFAMRLGFEEPDRPVSVTGVDDIERQVLVYHLGDNRD